MFYHKRTLFPFQEASILIVITAIAATIGKQDDNN
jgi:hypothetical protein